MPQSLANLHVHLIFSTKGRVPILSDAIREPLHAYMAKVLQNLNCVVVIINSVEDHIHLLFDLARTVSVSDAVKDVKSSSSQWLKTQGPSFSTFAWQAGFSIFAVSASNVEAVRRYIASQQIHHQKKSFQDEYRQILRKHGVAFDERFVWD